VSGTISSPLGLLGTSLLGTESPPLLAIEFLADSVGSGHHVTLFVLVRRARREGPRGGRGRARAVPAAARAAVPGSAWRSGTVIVTSGQHHSRIYARRAGSGSEASA
jgi:hypothetical protein